MAETHAFRRSILRRRTYSRQGPSPNNHITSSAVASRNFQDSPMLEISHTNQIHSWTSTRWKTDMVVNVVVPVTRGW
jgi:hypothetical protein